MRKIIIFLLLAPIFIFAQNLKGSNLIDTFIVSGPSIILEDNKATFEFQGIDYSLKKSQYFYFQTQLWPLEKTWQDVYTTQKYYFLPPGRRFYIFKVRAVSDNGRYDLTPAVYYFLTNISANYKDISIHPSFDGLSLRLVNNSSKKINVTGFRLKTSFINFIIPQAVKNFSPSQINKYEDIILEPNGDLVIKSVYSTLTSTPIGLDFENTPLSPLGVNFLGNKCFIYLNKDFPQLNYPVSYCDSFNLTPVQVLEMVLNGKISWRCATKLSLVGCSGVDSFLIDQFDDDPNCLGFINNWFNYDSCYQRNKDKDDFYEKTWFVYVDLRDEIEKQDRKPLKRLFRERFERIYLYDRNNLLVDYLDLF